MQSNLYSWILFPPAGYHALRSAAAFPYLICTWHKFGEIPCLFTHLSVDGYFIVRCARHSLRSPRAPPTPPPTHTHMDTRI